MSENDPRIERVLIAGVTGALGRQISLRLSQDGYDVRGLVRDEEQARFIIEIDPVPELVEGDVRHPWTLAPAFADVQAVICAVGARGGLFGLSRNAPRAVDFGGVRNLARAAAATGVLHFVLVSSILVTRPSFMFELVSGRVLHHKRNGEAALRASGVPYTIIRPGGLAAVEADGPAPDQVVVLGQGDQLTGRISRIDVAELCVRALQQPASKGKTLEAVARPDGPLLDWDDLYSALIPD